MRVGCTIVGNGMRDPYVVTKQVPEPMVPPAETQKTVEFIGL